MKVAPRGLRARSAVAFALSALVLSVALSLFTYQLARWYLLEQRESLAVRQVTVNALVAKGLVSASGEQEDEVVASLRSVSNARAVLRVGTEWYAVVVELSESAIPVNLVERVAVSGSGVQRVVLGGAPYLVVGLTLGELDAAYFEFVPMSELRRTLDTLTVVLILGASLTTIVGAVAGWAVSRRLMRPLTEVAAAARAMSAGDLSRRLDVGHDPDLEPVAASFNEMASSLEERIERELRFTADVSHELRTPLTAMASAVSLARRADLPGRAQFAVDVLDEQVEHLQRLTLELLEISRIDAGAGQPRRAEVDVVATVTRLLEAMGSGREVLVSRLGLRVHHRVDLLRFERVIANLIENADRYGGGATMVELWRDGDVLAVAVEDCGPGVPPSERIAIFGRFHRGGAEQPFGRPKGTGLGLALADEHVRLHGGAIWVEDSTTGGARFVATFPESADT